MRYVSGRTKKETMGDLPVFDHVGSIFAYAGLIGVLIATAMTAWFIPSASFNNPMSDIFLLLSICALILSFFLFSVGTRRIIRSAGTAFALARVFRESKDRLTRATAGSREGLWDLNIETGEAFFSESWHGLLSLPAGQVSSVDLWKKRIHPDDVIGVWATLLGHIEGMHATYVAEYRIKTNENEYIWIEDRGSNTADGPKSRIAGFSRDISNLKRAESALQSRTEELALAREVAVREAENARRFAQAVESATDAIAIATSAGNLTYANSAWESLTGYRMGDVRGVHCTAHYRGRTTKTEISALERALRLGESFMSENFVGTRKDGIPFEASITISPVRDRGVITFYTILEQDITRRKEIDRAKTEFVSLASHQLRTPLTAIRWYSEMLMKEGERELTKQEKKYVREIYEANLRMVELVGALLNVSRIDLGTFGVDPTLTDLTGLADSVIREMEPQSVAKNINVVREYDKNIRPVSVDPQLFRMVFQNLISNAVKYTPNDGLVRVAVKPDGTNIVISVSDTGIGIPTDQKAQIFGKLFRADNARELDPGGTGLGLYIVRAILEASGGSIRFESEEGKGTTFYGILPKDGSPHREGVLSLASSSAILSAS